MINVITKVVEFSKITIEKLSMASVEVKEAAKELDKPLNSNNFDSAKVHKALDNNDKLEGLDRSLNSDKVNAKKEGSGKPSEVGDVGKIEPPVVIEFTCPDGVDRKEFIKQLKGQERGLNSQTLAENMDNRAAYEQRKVEMGNGRDLSEGKKAQEIARDKAVHSRIESNQEKGLTYTDAKKEAAEWIKTQDALHNPDQIAGGDPLKVSRMGNASVNRSIGKQWGTRVDQLSGAIEDYAKGKTREELENTKMNVRLVAA